MEILLKGGCFHTFGGIMSTLTTRNPIAIQQLMSETLFQGNAVTTEHPIGNDVISPVKFLGANGKRILFLLDNPHHEYFTEEAEDAFLKTLAALKLSLDHVAVVNYGRSGKASIEAMRDAFNPKICIFLGRGGEESKHALHEIFRQDEVIMLNTYSFEEMLKDDEKKRVFWKAIKKLGVLS